MCPLWCHALAFECLRQQKAILWKVISCVFIALRRRDNGFPFQAASLADSATFSGQMEPPVKSLTMWKSWKFIEDEIVRDSTCPSHVQWCRNHSTCRLGVSFLYMFHFLIFLEMLLSVRSHVFRSWIRRLTSLNNRDSLVQTMVWVFRFLHPVDEPNNCPSKHWQWWHWQAV